MRSVERAGGAVGSDAGASGRTDPRVARSRAKVVAVARDLLVESGPRAVTVDAVVQRSGVARSTIYRHFPTREDVLAAALDALVPAAPELPDDGTDVVEALRHHLVRLAEALETSAWAAALPGVLELVSRDPGLEPYRRDFVRRHRQPLHALLRRAWRSGALTAPEGLAEDQAVDDLAALLIGPLFYRRLVTGEPLTPALVEQALTRALQPPAPLEHRPSTPLQGDPA